MGPIPSRRYSTDQNHGESGILLGLRMTDAQLNCGVVNAGRAAARMIWKAGPVRRCLANHE